MAKPSILLLDIETLPQTILAWTSYEANALYHVKHWEICCFTAKWLGDKKSITMGLDTHTEPELMTELWMLLDKADVAVAHNADGFDLRKINTRLLVHGFGPPSPYRTVDTLKICRKVFGFSSNKLDELCQQLGIGKKMRTGGIDLWIQCMEMNPVAWAKMRKYNAHDVALLEGLYRRIQPWIGQHPLPVRQREIANIRGNL